MLFQALSPYLKARESFCHPILSRSRSLCHSPFDEHDTTSVGADRDAACRAFPFVKNGTLMNKLAAILSLLCFLCGGMLGYSLAYSRIYQSLQEQKKKVPETVTETSPQSHFTQSDAAPFSQVIEETTATRVLPLDSVCEPVLDAIQEAATATMETLNRPTSSLIGLRRINEASRFFEESLLALLDAHVDLLCQIPTTQAGKTQRSGYPDLMITHQPTGRIFYLDPKLYELSSENSSLRTFYYTPRSETSKILKSGHHLLLGFGHDGKDGEWTFASWKLIDLSNTKLKLKSEFNSSNKELYQPANVVRASSKSL